MTRLSPLSLTLILSLFHFPSFLTPANGQILPHIPLKGPQPTTVVVRVVAHGAMVLGREVGGARITITDVETGSILATGLQQGEAGDQNQIMRTPRMMEEPIYSSRPSAAFTTTLQLQKPTVVEIAAEGPLAYPASLQRTSKTLLLIPGEDLTNDGIVLHLYGYLVHIERPTPPEPLIAKDDVKLRASVRTLSGSLVRPHGDWDSRKIRIYGEVLIGNRVMERLQMFYDEKSRTFEAPFFVPLSGDISDGITLRVIAADLSTGNSGMDQANYPVLNERVSSTPKH
ncbi:MAG: hypothetical protein OEU68_05250 [Nitrospira sp.]|nr:hypothetical protein [Nitrospira sp.]MDH4242872.1 hypothetical protein [Nitrospira sp.]MDH4357489.1 hypothetical protein [Nitrospira sp.]MDH5319722.1 hypothetical protein [Nitrospira sp.]